MICAIFAMDRMGGIGFENDYPWPITDTYRQWFAGKTRDQILIVGGRTWDKMVKYSLWPWAKKIYVATSHCTNNNVTCVSGDLIAEIKSIEKQYPTHDIYIAGGKRIFETTRHICDYMHIAHVNSWYRADTRIYSGYFLSGFQARSAGPSADRQYTFMTYHNLFPL